MKTLWKERFNPSPAKVMPPNPKLYHGKLWDWTFEKDADGNYIRAGLVLLIVRQKAKELRVAGVKGDVAQMATLDVFFAYGASGQGSGNKMAIKGVPARPERV